MIKGHWVYSNFVFISLFLSSCITYERLDVAAPQSGAMTRQDVTIFGQPRKVEVYFPAGSKNEAMELYFAESEGALVCGADRNSRYVVHEVQSLKTNKETIIRVYLQLNHLQLPTYQSPREREFREAPVFATIGRLHLSELKVKGHTVRDEGFCNASVVGPDLVLTAAHCISDQLGCELAQFLIWNDGHYDTYACKELLVSKRSSDQALIRLNSKISSRFQVAPVENWEFYYAKGTSVFILTDETLWQRSRGKVAPKDGKGSKKLQPCQVVGSAYTMQTLQTRGSLEARPTLEMGELQTRLTNYVLDCDAVPGQSGSPILNLEGKIIGVLVATGAKFTPLDREIAARLQSP